MNYSMMFPYTSSSSFMNLDSNCFDHLMQPDICPFDANLRNPIVYIMQPRNQQNNNKEDKGGFFTKAFDWYTKERLAKGMSEEESMYGFASWLDMKYDEYHKQVTCKSDQKIKSSPGRSKSVEVILEPKEIMSRPASICQYHGATAGLDKSVVIMCSCKKLKSCEGVKAAQSDHGQSSFDCCSCKISKASKPKKGNFLKAFREFGDKVQPISPHEYLPSCKHVNMATDNTQPTTMNNKEQEQNKDQGQNTVQKDCLASCKQKCLKLTPQQELNPSCKLGCLKHVAQQQDFIPFCKQGYLNRIEQQELFPPNKQQCLNRTEQQESFSPNMQGCLNRTEQQESFSPNMQGCLNRTEQQESFSPNMQGCLKRIEPQELFPPNKQGCLNRTEQQEPFSPNMQGCLNRTEQQESFSPNMQGCLKRIEPQELFPPNKQGCLNRKEQEELFPPSKQECLNRLQQEFIPFCKQECLNRREQQELNKQGCINRMEQEELIPARKQGCLKHTAQQESIPSNKQGFVNNTGQQESVPMGKHGCLKNTGQKESIPSSKQAEHQECDPSCKQDAIMTTVHQQFTACTVQTPIRLCRLNRARKKTVNLQTSDLYIIVDEVTQPNPTFIKISPAREYLVSDKQ